MATQHQGQGSSAGGEAEQIEFTLEKTAEEERAELMTVAMPIIGCGIPASCFDRDAAINAGFSYRGFLKHVRFIAGLSENGVLPTAISLGIQRKLFMLPINCTMKNLVDLSRFLKSTEGQSLLGAALQEQKVRKRAGAQLTVQEVVVGQVFAAQRQELGTTVKVTRSKWEHKIADLRSKLRIAERDMEREIAEVKDRFAPASFYEEPAEGKYIN